MIIDGGNSNFQDTMRRAEAAAEHGIDFIDCGHERRHLGT